MESVVPSTSAATGPAQQPAVNNSAALLPQQLQQATAFRADMDRRLRVLEEIVLPKTA
ncbi:hypothetical protein [Hymenobacter swuensis]|uniref:Uncharacterized protein n=1 Tax=Hymenobacter swuensis DY53 TaxID=1227739 RepID=W8EXE5_9BACT|nr:hypothetical protein [Hymenobacter swuensis]AHJ97258.1 hypothetical protein Hsw_1663 [Hymenobacter swuensis DY53]